MPKHKILIVDDEANILNSLARLLHDQDCEIYTAGTVKEALEKLKSIDGVDLIISDNRLPDITGVEFLIKAKQLYPDTMRILITGYPDLESVIRAINNGQVYRFITKPWENEELRLIIKQTLEYYDVLKENRILLNIARQQADSMDKLQKKYPQIPQEELRTGNIYVIDEHRVSETLEDFLKKYYPQQLKK